MTDQRDQFDPVVKRRDAARRLGCCVRTLQNLEKRGELTPIFITGKLIGYRDSALRRFVHERTGIKLGGNEAFRKGGTPNV